MGHPPISQPTALASRASISSVRVPILPSPRGLLQILSDHDASNRLTGVFRPSWHVRYAPIRIAITPVGKLMRSASQKWR